MGISTMTGNGVFVSKDGLLAAWYMYNGTPANYSLSVARGYLGPSATGYVKTIDNWMPVAIANMKYSLSEDNLT